jgi:acetyl-CoA synthetase
VVCRRHAQRSYNCLDRNVERGLGDKTAIIFEADDGAVTKVTYSELLAKVCQFANALKARGVKKGDRVIIYMSMSVEGVAAMQACARIGATTRWCSAASARRACATASRTPAP